MQVLILALLCCCCEVFGRPSDPVIREFGTQPNNPNVKVFSTYPTLKPLVIKDNPNDLEKGPDQKKYEKDEREATEAKGKEITKVQSNLTDTTALDESEDVTEDTILDPNSLAEEPIQDETTDVLTASENEEKNKSTNDMSALPTDDGRSMNETSSDSSTILEETNNSEINPQVEIGADRNPEVGIVPGMEEIVVPIAEYDLIEPLPIDSPVTIIPAIAEELGDIPEDDSLFAIPKMDLNEDEIYELDEGNPLLNAGVILPELIPMGANSEVVDGEILPVIVEPTTFSPIIADEVAINNDTNVDISMNAPEAKQPVAEMPGEFFEPMASLTGESVLLDPIAEEEDPTVNESQNGFNEESVATDGNAIDNTPMEGDLGVSVSMKEEIPPIVEVEPESPAEVIEETMGSDVQASDDNEGGKDDNATKATLVEESTDQSIHMAGFMSEVSKSFPDSDQTTEGTLPSATDLSLTLNINDTEGDLSSTSNTNTQTPTQVEPMDQLDMIDNHQPTSDVDSLPSSTTEEPTLNPMELTEEEELNEDPTLNEAI